MSFLSRSFGKCLCFLKNHTDYAKLILEIPSACLSQVKLYILFIVDLVWTNGGQIYGTTASVMKVLSANAD